ncbi:hypothetical protein CB1_000954014 [Camelus ferus]|nr:hypothetical protein CB1_000954014 [Camelus ferus]
MLQKQRLEFAFYVIEQVVTLLYLVENEKFIPGETPLEQVLTALTQLSCGASRQQLEEGWVPTPGAHGSPPCLAVGGQQLGTGTQPFNRAMLFNVGFKEAMKDSVWDCVIFHDVDHLPENDRNYYGCGEMPRHFAAKLDKYMYM